LFETLLRTWVTPFFYIFKVYQKVVESVVEGCF
jgi:hypothetical protein